MRLLFEETRKEPGTMILLTKAESDALVTIVGVYLGTKPRKNGPGFKLATKLDSELLC